MMLVIDASVALKWFIEEEGTPQALSLLGSEQRLIAPDLIIAELCNAAWRLLRQGYLAAEQLTIIAEQAGWLFAERIDLQRLAPRAAAIARMLNHPVYDAFYLALAELRNVPLVTADERLLRRLDRTEWQDRVLSLRNTPSTS